MKLIINIPDRVYEEMLKNKGTDKSLDYNEGLILEVAAENGIPLPKGHGDLIDRSKLLIELECGIRAGNYEEGYEKYPHINDMDDCFDTVKYADTIIEADKENK